MATEEHERHGVYDNEASGFREQWLNGKLIWFMHKGLLKGKPDGWSDEKFAQIQDSPLFKMGEWQGGKLVYGTKHAMPLSHTINRP